MESLCTEKGGNTVIEDRFSLCGKVAVVTGATGTFGLDFCRTFANYVIHQGSSELAVTAQ